MRPSERAEVTLLHPAEKRSCGCGGHHAKESFVFISKLQGPSAVPMSDPNSKPQGTLGEPDAEEPQL